MDANKDDFRRRTDTEQGAPGPVAAGNHGRHLTECTAPVVKGKEAARHQPVRPKLTGMGMAADVKVPTGFSSLMDMHRFVFHKNRKSCLIGLSYRCRRRDIIIFPAKESHPRNRGHDVAVQDPDAMAA